MCSWGKRASWSAAEKNLRLFAASEQEAIAREEEARAAEAAAKEREAEAKAAEAEAKERESEARGMPRAPPQEVIVLISDNKQHRRPMPLPRKMQQRHARLRHVPRRTKPRHARLRL